jgi:hypothetical protein
MKAILVIVLISLAILATCKEHPEAKLYFTDYCRRFFYPSQIHQVTTEDGYVLTVFRIQKKNSQFK